PSESHPLAPRARSTIRPFLRAELTAPTTARSPSQASETARTPSPRGTGAPPGHVRTAPAARTRTPPSEPHGESLGGDSAEGSSSLRAKARGPVPSARPSTARRAV